MLRKMLQTAGLCLASVLVMGIGLAGNASAANGLLWLVCLPGEGLTRYTSSRCLTAGGTGNPRWESRGLLAGEEPTVRILAFTILLRDTKTLLGESEVQCFDLPGQKSEGVLEANGKGKVRVAEVTNPKENCRGKKVCKETEVEEVRGVNLPWNIELFEGPGGKLLTNISNSGAGEPGWKVKCNTVAGSQEDRCTSASTEKLEKTELISEVTGGELLVRARFENEAHGNCTLGGTGAAELTGLVAILLPGGAVSTTKV
jgi:hypothetical protein